MIIGHNDDGIGGGYYLDSVVIEKVGTESRWVFPCHRWLAKAHDDGKIERELMEQSLWDATVPSTSIFSSQICIFVDVFIPLVSHRDVDLC
jgi:hypothetical protein